jgi:hypothetical protein
VHGSTSMEPLASEVSTYARAALSLSMVIHRGSLHVVKIGRIGRGPRRVVAATPSSVCYVDQGDLQRDARASEQRCPRDLDVDPVIAVPGLGRGAAAWAVRAVVRDAVALGGANDGRRSHSDGQSDRRR